MFSSFPENLLQNSVDESWTDTNLNRVSVIQFLDEPKGDDDEESGAERRVRNSWRLVGSLWKHRDKLSFLKMGSHCGVHVSPCDTAVGVCRISAV